MDRCATAAAECFLPRLLRQRCLHSDVPCGKLGRADAPEPAAARQANCCSRYRRQKSVPESPPTSSRKPSWGAGELMLSLKVERPLETVCQAVNAGMNSSDPGAEQWPTETAWCRRNWRNSAIRRSPCILAAERWRALKPTSLACCAGNRISNCVNNSPRNSKPTLTLTHTPHAI